MTTPKVFAHRGASAYAPENTLPAFALAARQARTALSWTCTCPKTASWWSSTTKRWTAPHNGTGAVKDHTLAELQALCADNGMSGFAGARIPTLREVLELVRPTGMLVNIELKTSLVWYDGIEEKTLALVEALGMQERVIYSSFNHYSIERVRQLAPQAQTAYLFAVLSAMWKVRRRPRRGRAAPGLCNVRMADFPAHLPRQRLAVRVWTVNEADDLRWLLAAGADVITNAPARALAVRATLQGG